MNNLGGQIKNVREFKNLTQKYVATRLGMSQSKFARIESGAIHVTDELLLSISKILETNSFSIQQFDKKVFRALQTLFQIIYCPKENILNHLPLVLLIILCLIYF